eukprot:6603347-Pyramimonas_sp.AAC.1
MTLQTLSGTGGVGLATPVKRLITCERGDRAKGPVCCAHPLWDGACVGHMAAGRPAETRAP